MTELLIQAEEDLDPARPLHEHGLANGLRVVIDEDRRLPLVAVNLWYLVGSRDEAPGRTGFAHLFEHVMFEGSANVAKGEHFAVLQSVGATLNATTSFDRTNYFETVPSSHLNLALWLEADRMGGLALSQETFDNQRAVVKNEKRQRYDNAPYGDTSELLHGLAYPGDHPYHHLPIGSMADLDAASVEDARAFHASWYVPGNCVLSIVGDVDPDEAIAQVEHYFGGIPDGPGLPAHPAPALEPVLDGPHMVLRRAEVPAAQVTVALRAGPCHPSGEHAAVHVLADVIGRGRGSRLYRELVVRRELIEPAHGLLGCSRLAGDATLLSGRYRVRAGVAPQEVSAAFEAVLAEVAAGGITAEELARIRVIAERDHHLRLGDAAHRADRYGKHASVFGDPTLTFDELTRIRSVRLEDVAAVAQRVLAPTNRVVIVHEPGEAA